MAASLEIVRPKIADEHRKALRDEFLALRPSINPLVRFYSYWLEEEVFDLRLEVNRLRVALLRAKSKAASAG